MVVVSTASSGREAIKQFREHRPDVTLMDLRLPDVSGIDTMMAIRVEFPEALFLVQSSFMGDVEIQQSLQAGARGYISKRTDPKDIVEAIRKAHTGMKWLPVDVAAALAEHVTDEELTTREVEVLQKIAEGNRNRTIAKLFFINEATVKVHVKHIMDKLGANDRAQAVAIAARRGIIQL